MKSRITIEVDFENGNRPIIKIVSSGSDDVRDQLIDKFLSELNSRWAKIEYIGQGMNDAYLWKVSPISKKELLKEFDVMAAELEETRKQ